MKKHNPMRFFLALAGSLLTLTGLLTLIFTWIAYQSATHGEGPGLVLRPQRAETPFTWGSGNKPAELAAMMKLPVYPGSVAEESTLSLWLPVPRQKSGKGVGLALLRLQVGVRPATAESWYKDRLGPDFIKTEGGLNATLEKGEDWLRRVCGKPNPDSILFLRSGRRTKSGVLLEADHEGETIILFRYDGPRS